MTVKKKPEWDGPWPLLEGFKAERYQLPVKKGESAEIKRGRRAYRKLRAAQRRERATSTR